MLDLFYKWDALIVSTKDKNDVQFDTTKNTVILDGYDVTHPWEFEKWGILLEVKQYADALFYKFLVSGYHMVIILSDNFELKEDILSFFGDVDILIIKWTKAGAKIYESIEAKLVVPYGVEKEIFLNTLGQSKDPVEVFKIKGQLNGEITEFINLG